MVAIAFMYAIVGLVLGWAWIAPELRSWPDRELWFDFLCMVLGWPVFAIVFIVLVVATKSKKAR